MFNLYPWQISDYDYLMSLTKRLPSSILLHGPSGVGALNIALAFSARLLCENPKQEQSCGNCRSCNLLMQNSHPDFYRLEPDPDDEKKNKVITVAEVRSAVEYISLSTHLAEYKIILIENSGWLNLNSANALLKVLEEPPMKVLFILITDNLNKMLPTIKSRCHKYGLTLPSKEQALAYLTEQKIDNSLFWLSYYNSCPLFEAELTDTQLANFINTLLVPSIDNIFLLVQDVDGKTVSFSFFVDFMLKWISDLSSYQLSQQMSYFGYYMEAISGLIVKLHREKAFYLVDKLTHLSLWATHPLNYKLQIENILLQYQQLFVK